MDSYLCVCVRAQIWPHDPLKNVGAFLTNNFPIVWFYNRSKGIYGLQ